MKAINSAEWQVSILEGDKAGVTWVANTEDYVAMYETIDCDRLFPTFKEVEDNWEKFAKLNGIKNWKYV